MLLSLNWLRDYLGKPDIKIDPHELADALTMRGLQVASVRKPTTKLSNVVVGRIDKIDKHPNADKLQVTQVVTSDKPDTAPLQIVCGAKNIAVGDIVPVALPGAVLPGDFAIKVSTIRGVESHGMICSGKELAISDDTDGILQLPKHSALGQPLSRLLGGESDDTIIEFELTANRHDGLGVMGLAREIAAILKTDLRDPKPAKFKITPHRTSSIVMVEVRDTAMCPRYVARVVDGLKVAPSPDWIKRRLEITGMKPINNIVDITNFVMLEYGQPLHAFDLRKIESGKIFIDSCKQPTPFTLLNGESIEIQPGDIVIYDGERPIALAGIMGGLNSQIEEDTTSIILESAAFYAPQIRKTAKRLGLKTDSSTRFEKGSDLAAVGAASERAAALLRDSFNANVYHPPIDTNEFGVKEDIISVDMRDVRKVVGVESIQCEQASELLAAIGIPSHRKSTNVLSVRLPTFRPDLKESIDVIEEIARLYGYDNIPLKYPKSHAMFDRLDETRTNLEWSVRTMLQGLGLRETLHYSFVSEEALQKYGFLSENVIRLRNPISEEMKCMRTSLLPSLLQTYAYNSNRKQENQRIFELANTYLWDSESETKARETLHVSGLLSGQTLAPAWNHPTIKVDFFFVKGLVEAILKKLTNAPATFKPLSGSRVYHPKRSASITVANQEVGTLGEVHPFVQKQVLETQESVCLFELNIEALAKMMRGITRYKVPSKFPTVEVDLALVVVRTTKSEELLETIKKSAGNLLTDVSLFDLYEGSQIPEDKKSLAFRLTFGAKDRTLLDSEITAAKEQVVKSLADRHAAQLRT